MISNVIIFFIVFNSLIQIYTIINRL